MQKKQKIVHLHFSYKQLNVSLGCVENLFYFLSGVDLHISSFISSVPFPFSSGLDLYFFQFIDIYLLAASCKFEVYSVII